MFKKSDVKNMFDLTPMQAGILFHYMMDEKSFAYFEQMMLSVSGYIDDMLFEKAFNKVIEKYDVLRTVFLHKKVKTPIQVVLKQRQGEVNFSDISHLPEEEKKSFVLKLAQQDKEKGFNLEKDILIRVAIIKTAANKYTIIWSHHHIIMDGWCLGIVVNDFMHFYLHPQEGKDIRIETAPPYSRYLQWLDRQDKNKGLRFWKTYLEGYEKKAVLPFLKQAPAPEEPGQTKYKLEEYHILIDETTSSALTHIAKENEVTLNIIFQVIWGLLLRQYNNTDDVVFGAVVSGRPGEIEDIESIVGLFINTIPIRLNIVADQPFSNVVKTFQEQELAAKRYEYLPLADIQAQTLLNRNLLDHIIVFENYPVQEYMELTGEQGHDKLAFRVEAAPEYYEQSNYDFNIVISPRNQINLRFSFNSLRYESADIARIASHFNEVARQIIENPDRKVKTIEIITPEEKQQILYEFNHQDPGYFKNNTIHRLFEDQTGRTPGNIAVGAPIDLNDIYDQLESEKINPHLKEKMNACCFRKNPYIYQYELELSTNSHNDSHLYILKTHRHNSVIVNANVVQLLESFSGNRNLKSIYSWVKEIENLKGLHFEFFIYSMANVDLLEVTFQFNRQPEVFSIHGYEDFARLVRSLSGNHLIELVDFRLGESFEKGPFIDSFGEDRRWCPDEINLEKALISNKELTNTQVLLLGDTPGMPTTGLLYLGAYLRRKGIKTCCQFYDPTADYALMKENVQRLLKDIQPKIVAVSMKWFLYIARVIDICRIIKEYSRENFLDIEVVVGGNTASYYWQEVIKYDCIDILVKGDGEEPLLKICQGKDIANIPNCVYKKNGAVIQNPVTYIQDESNSPGIYLSHLEEILLSPQASRLGTFFIYTHKGCAMNCFYCGGCSQAQQKTFNREKVLRRGIEAVRKDIIAAQPYTSTFHFEFDIPDTVENLLDYCKKIWEGIDLTEHFCIFSTLKPASAALIRLVSQTFKYVYWDFDICTFSERHRKQLFSLGLVKPQPSDNEIFDFMAHCDKYSNIEVRLNLITGLPCFKLEDIEPGERLLSKIMNTYYCFGELHWARLHAQPGAPILENAGKHQMHSYASTFEDFLKFSRKNFNQDSGYSTVEHFNYPYIYFNDDRLNSRVTSIYLETNKKIHQLRVDRQRGLIACHTLTYEELNEKAEQLAGKLREKGIKPAGIIGLMLERSLEIPVGILGILKAGCAYMPIDPEFPVARIEYMLKDSNAGVLVTTPKLQVKVKIEVEERYIEIIDISNLSSFSSSTLTSTSRLAASADNLAYVIYTSGTTGKPKGVLLNHENLANYVHWFTTTTNLTDKERTVLTSSFAFDLGYTSLYTSLLNGSELHILPREIFLLGERLLDYIRQKGITYIKVTPSLFSVIVNSPNFSAKTCETLRVAVIGGEAIDVEDIEKAHSLCSHLQIINHYGPTETTIGCVATFVDFHRFQEYKRTPVIGKPIHNTNVYILGKDLNLMPVGIPGELCISGVGVGKGYLNQPGLTTEKFSRVFYRSYRSYMTYIPKKVYRTGDLARWLPNGTIEFLGRIDTQVKIRGYRVELGEIENRLAKHPAVGEAVVVVKEAAAIAEKGNDNKYLCAYIVARERTGKPAVEKITGDKNKQLLPEKRIHRASVAQFVDHAKKNYNKIAVKSNGRSLTYGSLNNAANRLAHQILAEYDDRYRLSKSERIRYKRQMLLHGWGIESQEKLKSTTVFVAGAGGGASPTIMQLALAGIGTIKVCDFDEVELSNLNRQFLHNEERLGMNKALSAQATVSKINPHVKVIPYIEKLTRDNVFELVGNADIIFDMFDGPADKFILSECAVAKGIPHIIISMTDINAYTAVCHTPQTPCYYCLFDRKKLETIVSGMQNYIENYSRNPLPVVATSLFISTGIAVNEALKILLRFKKPAYNKFFYFNQRGEEENLVYTPGYKAMTYLFSDYFLQVCKEQGFDWDTGWRGNFLEELAIKPDPRCPLCSDQGKELRKNLEKKIKKADNAVNIKETDEVKKEEERLKTVGILLAPEIEMATAIMATLKAGKSFVPLDPAIPEKSRLYVLEDSEARIILTADQHLKLAERLRDRCNRNIKIININTLGESGPLPEKTLPLKENIEMNPAPIAYLLYLPDPMKDTGFNAAVTDLYTTLVKAEGSYTFSSTDYFLTTDPTSLPVQLRDYLSKELPDYMVPSYFVQMDKIPLTPNGKVDRKALPDPGVKEKNDYIAPGNELEEKIAGIWAEVLGKEKNIIGIDTNFFELGGHSLNATILVSRIHKELNIRIPLAEFFKIPTIKGLSDHIQDAEEETFVSIEPVKEKEYYKLSSAQKRLYILQQMGENNIAYNLFQGFPLSRDVDKEKLAAIFNQLIARHETLRTSFEVEEGEPVQKIHKNIELSLQHYKTDETGLENVRQSFTRPFDLSKAPLLRAGLVEIEAPSPYYYLLVEMHHIISDEISQNLLQKEFMTLFSGQESAPLELQYKDFSEWENSQAQQEAVKKQGTYWLKQFEGQLPVLNLPVDFPRPAVQNNEGFTVGFHLPLKDSTALRTIARQEGATMFMVLLTVYSIFLAKLCNQEDIILGVPVAGRKYPDLQKIIGVFINSLALRNFPGGEKTVRELFKEVKTNTLEAFENQEYPFEDLVERVIVERDASRNPIFDVMLNLVNQEDFLETIPAVDDDTGNSYAHVKGRVRFDMNLVAVDSGERVFCIFFYCAALFKSETIERFLDYFKKITSQVPGNLDRRIADIEIISEAEKQQLLLEFNAFAADYPRDKVIIELFEEQVRKTPDSLVLVFEDNQITYRQSNEQANRLGRLLISKGVQPDTLVSLMVQRSVEMVVGIWGILKSGGAYLPINPEAPGDRITYMLDNASVTILLTQEKFVEKFADRYQVINLNSPVSYKKSCANPGCKNAPTDLAYVIYTSGSTGKPKGVMIQNRSVINIVKWFAAQYHLQPGFQLLQMFEYTFDASINQIFGSLLNGVTLHVIRKEYFFDIEFLRDYIIAHFINLINFVQSVIKEVLCGKEKIESLKYVISGAEKLKSTIKNEILDNGYALFNQYGPTEVTVDALAEKCSYESNGTVGVPVYNARCYIVNKYGRLNPVGVPGELWVSGDGLARGYINNVELTAEKFTSTPFIPGIKVYRTGDLTRWLPAGNVEFLGRIDTQVKIRGFRIEPVEIANQLVKIDGIKEAVVIDREDASGETYLCAYLVREEEMDELENSEIKNILSRSLPDYMIPSYYVWIERLPLSGHGKLIRSALPEPNLEITESYVPPSNHLERKLVNIWSEVLNIDKQIIGINSDFFELGGHSLKATILVSRIHKELNIRLPLADLFINPTIRELSQIINGLTEEKFASIEPVEKKEYYELSAAQKRLWILNQVEKEQLAYNIPGSRGFEKLNREAFEKAIEALIKRHESLRTTFVMVSAEPKQKIHDYESLDFKVNYLDLRKEKKKEEVIGVLSEKERSTPFNLAAGPLLRTRLLHIEEERFLFLYTMHHIISDAWSMSVMEKEFIALYGSYSQGNENALAPMRIQYKDYTQWHIRQMSGEGLKKLQNFWRNRFRGEIPILKLPTDYPRPKLKSSAGEFILFYLNKEITMQLKHTCRENGATLFIILLAAVNVFLYRYTGQTDLIVGTPVSGREHKDLENQIGFYVNMLALRNRLNKEQSFREVLQAVKRSTLEAFDHQLYPFDLLIHDLNLVRDLSHNPLFDVVVTAIAENNRLEYIEESSGRKENDADDSFESGAAASKYDFRLRFREKAGQIVVHIQYNPELFKKVRIMMIRERFINLITDIVSNIDKKIENFNLMTELEQKKPKNTFKGGF
jgi:amino acid adenylation domain-containing protein